MSILSIQSHVVHGYVGNRAATFALQTLGFDVDVINTVTFTNHSSYPSKKGRCLLPEEFDELLVGLKESGVLDRTRYLLTGYIGKPELVASLADRIRAMKASNPETFYLCDTVCGDDGRMYVSEECVPHLRTLVSLADIARMNIFELGVITGIEDVASEEGLNAALDKLHGMGIPMVLVSNMGTDVAVTLSVKDATSHIKHIVRTERIPFFFTGTGDLFTALFLGHYLREKNAPVALQLAVSALFDVCQVTLKAYKSANVHDGNAMRPAHAADADARELRIVSCQHLLANPEKRFDVSTVRMTD
eukprot:PhM_4_TR12915/c0_g1_i1/m.53198/K00868/pdxK, pdxY; pyridoxine kinase